MSTPIQSPQGAAAAPPTQPPRSRGPARLSQPTAAAPAVLVDTLPSGPPPQLLEEVHAAGALFDQLVARGYRLTFESGEGGALLHGPDGSAQRMTLADVVRLASGEVKVTG